MAAERSTRLLEMPRGRGGERQRRRDSRAAPAEPGACKWVWLAMLTRLSCGTLAQEEPVDSTDWSDDSMAGALPVPRGRGRRGRAARGEREPRGEPGAGTASDPPESVPQPSAPPAVAAGEALPPPPPENPAAAAGSARADGTDSVAPTLIPEMTPSQVASDMKRAEQYAERRVVRDTESAEKPSPDNDQEI